MAIYIHNYVYILNIAPAVMIPEQSGVKRAIGKNLTWKRQDNLKLMGWHYNNKPNQRDYMKWTKALWMEKRSMSILTKKQ